MPATLRLRQSLTLAATTLTFAACDSSSGVQQNSLLAPDSAHPASNPDSSGGSRNTDAVASIRISPHQITLATAGSITLAVTPVDKNGVPTFALLAGRATWRITNASIAQVNDAGNIVGVAAGSTKVFATVGTYIDSALVTVVSERDTVSPPAAPPSNPAPVTSFSLSVLAFRTGTPMAAGDSSTNIRFPGATVSVYRMTANPGVASDTLGTFTLIGTALTDTNGRAAFSSLPFASYRVTVEGVVNGMTLSGESSVGPPATDVVQIGIFLHK